MSAAVRAAWYVPWTARNRVERSCDLRISYDKTAVTVGDTVVCTVEARRKSLDGHGMMIAEVGLPPGAEVDRSSVAGLTRGLAEVEPDRVVLYLWPGYREAETMRFQFRVRFAMKAKTAPSVLWDYYNPEAWVELVPVTFKVAAR